MATLRRRSVPRAPPQPTRLDRTQDPDRSAHRRQAPHLLTSVQCQAFHLGKILDNGGCTLRCGGKSHSGTDDLGAGLGGEKGFYGSPSPSSHDLGVDMPKDLLGQVGEQIA